jgi:FkbM family methyltransferase
VYLNNEVNLLHQFLETISYALTNSYERTLLSYLKKNTNLVILGFDARIYGMLNICTSNGGKVTHICIPENLRQGLEFTNIKIVDIDDLFALRGSTTVLVCGDGWLAAFFVNLLRKHGIQCVLTLPPLEKYRENENKIVANMLHLWKVYNYLNDEVSKDIFLSLLKYKITGDLSDLVMSEFPQYYHDKVRPEPGDTIIDGGAFDGGTGVNFIKSVGGNAKVIGFEPNKENAALAKKSIKDGGFENKSIIIEAGLGAFSSIAYIQGNGPGSFTSEKETTNSQVINIQSIDEYCRDNDEKIDLIKLDIEGYELAALKGARGTIARLNPKLQICLYHKMEDLWEIPLFINGINRRYNFYLAHHYIDSTDTYLENQLTDLHKKVAKEYGFYEFITGWETILYCLPQI